MHFSASYWIPNFEFLNFELGFVDSNPKNLRVPNFKSIEPEEKCVLQRVNNLACGILICHFEFSVSRNQRFCRPERLKFSDLLELFEQSELSEQVRMLVFRTGHQIIWNISDSCTSLAATHLDPPRSIHDTFFQHVSIVRNFDWTDFSFDQFEPIVTVYEWHVLGKLVVNRYL